MNRQDVMDAMAEIEAEGLAVTNAKIRERLGRGSLRDIQRMRRDIAAETVTARAATAVAEEPEPQAAAPVEQPDTQLEGAQARFEAARAHLAAVERDTQGARNQGLLLTTALRAGTLSRQAPAWRPFDAAQQQLAQATQAVEQAQEDLQAAQRTHQARLREHAAAAYAATAEGKSLLAEIAELQRYYADAVAREVGSVASYSHMLGVKRHAFQEGVSALLAASQPAPQAPAPSGPPSRLSVEVLRPCYLHDGEGGIGRRLPAGIERFEPADLPVLVEFRAVLRQELEQANREYRGYEMDDAMSAMSWHDPRALPLRQARQRCGILHSAVQMVSQDLQSLHQRARDEGRAI